MSIATMKDSIDFLILMNMDGRFRPAVVQKVLHETLKAQLAGKTYDAENVPQWTAAIGTEVKTRLRGRSEW